MSSTSPTSSRPAQVCPVCLRSPTAPMKVTGSCKHAVCVKCLIVLLEKVPSDSKVFPCPTCQVESPLLGTRADSFVDYVENVGDSSIEGSPGSAIVKRVADAKAHNEEQCISCQHKRNEWVRAEYLCIDCGRIYFCDDCNKAHGTKRATKDHHVVHLEIVNEKGNLCELHDQIFNKYCSTCKEPVCPLCILFEHDDHTFKEIRDVFRELTDDVESSVKEQEERIKYIKNEMSGLCILKDVVDDEKGALLKSVEDHSEKCIELILKQKEALKVQISTEVDITDLSECLAGIPALVKILNESVIEANDVLSRRDIGPAARLEKLSTAKEHLEACRGEADKIDCQHYRTQSETACANIPDFVPSTTEFTLGTLRPQNTCMLTNETKNIDKYVVSLEKTYKVEDASKFINSVVCLGNKYAVAHPTNSGVPADAIDIYAFPGTLKRTIRDHVYPLHAMARTPDENLAVLSDGSSDASMCVKRFNTLTGFVRSSADLLLNGTLLSFDVNNKHQYVILSKPEDRQRLITIFRGDGTVVNSCAVQEHPFVNFNCIACFGDKYAVTGESIGIVYTCTAEPTGKTMLIKAAHFDLSNTVKVQHISVSTYGFNFSYYYGNTNALGSANKSLSERRYKYYVGKPAVGTDIHSRISEGNSYIVASQGHTVRVLTPP